jgi:hypothetical protein
MAVAILFGEQENTEQVNCVVSSMIHGGSLRRGDTSAIGGYSGHACASGHNLTSTRQNY